jgi:uroporphyrinogen III methyltransferase/synthase
VTVYLVGAGPGDPGLLTVRAAAVLARADVVVHDRLAEPSLLDLAPAGAERIDVGKAPGAPVAQAEINDLLVERGRAGAEVVRLKGGDPFVFGRGGEEALALAAAGVRFEVVPGITSAIAVPAYAGVPVTHRGLATSFTVVTGHSRHAVDTETHWESLAAVGGTIIILMGVAHRGEISRRLLAGGLDPATPVAAVTWGTRPAQRSIRTTLSLLATIPLQPPATIVVGAVAGLDLAWYEQGPLFGRTIVVTRARSQASDLTAQLAALGAEVIEAPTIAIAPPADDGVALARAAAGVVDGRYAWVVFTSANAVSRLADLIPDARAWAGTRIAAVGPATAEALGSYRLIADLVPARALAEGLVEEFPDAGRDGPDGAARDADAGAGPDAAGREAAGREAAGRASRDAARRASRGAFGRSSRAAAGGDDAGRAAAGRDGRPPAVLFPRAAAGRDVIVDGLATKGWSVEVVEAYRNTVAVLSPAVAQAAADADAICFTSSSTVTNYLAAGSVRVPSVVACIGPVTAETARGAGLTVDVVATPHTIPGLVDALLSVLGPI